MSDNVKKPEPDPATTDDPRWSFAERATWQPGELEPLLDTDHPDYGQPNVGAWPTETERSTATCSAR